MIDGMHRIRAVCVAAAVLACTACAAPAPAPAPAPAAATAQPHAAPATCPPDTRPDLYVRAKKPGLPWQAGRIGGGQVYDHLTRRCVGAVALIAATSPTDPGYCTQVAEAAANPGYDPDLTPSPPLRRVIAHYGAGC